MEWYEKILELCMHVLLTNFPHGTQSLLQFRVTGVQ